MIYLFHGSDSTKVRQKAFQWVEAARRKAPEAAYIRIPAEEVTPESLASACASSGLFFSKSLILVDDPFALKAAGEAVLAALADLAASPNPIAIVAPKLLAATAKKLEGKAEKVFTYAAAEKKVRGFNSGLVNALGSRDGKALWEELQKAEREGDAPEMLHGLLHWKARDLMSKGSRVWKPAEARALSIALIELLSDARSESEGLGVALERFALSLPKRT